MLYLAGGGVGENSLLFAIYSEIMMDYFSIFAKFIKKSNDLQLYQNGQNCKKI